MLLDRLILRRAQAYILYSEQRRYTIAYRDQYIWDVVNIQLGIGILGAHYFPDRTICEYTLLLEI